MSIYIQRHNFNPKMIGVFSVYFYEKLPKLKDILKGNPKISGTLFRQALEGVPDAVVSEEEDEYIIKMLKAGTDLGLNCFRNVINIPNAEFQLLGEHFKVHTEATKAYIDPVSWNKYFYFALLSGNRAAINELISIPESVMKKAQLKADEVDFAIVRFLKGLYTTDIDLGRLLKDAMLLSDPAKNASERTEYLLYIKAPELNLYRLIFGNDNIGFNQALENALILHKKFWETTKNQNAAEGWISYPILCACKIASESKDYDIMVESDYLPKLLF